METSQLISSANPLTGFYMIATLAFNKLSCDYASLTSELLDYDTMFCSMKEFD